MTTIQKLAWIYAIGFFSIVLLGHIPGFTDENGLLLGGFRIDPIDDVLHGFSGLWAAYGAWKGHKSAVFYFKAFGSFYTADAILGFFTGYAFTDFVTLNFGANAGHSMANMHHNVAVNLPHFIIGPVALFIGLYLSKKLAKNN